jgi:hypothetical protein
MGMADLGMELSRVLFREEPKLLACDLEASARAAAAVSNLLGCILATVLAEKGEQAYFEACKTVMLKMNESAIATAAKAQGMTPNLTPQ